MLVCSEVKAIRTQLRILVKTNNNPINEINTTEILQNLQV